MAISTDMLAAFVQVAERASVSAAALELGVGKSLVSKRIAQLEAAVKATLFARSTRRIALTPAGEAYLDFARRALHEVGSAQERLRDLRAELGGRIRMTAPVSWGQRVLARQLPGFLKLHPGVEIELQLADRVMDVAYERIDLALRWSRSSVPELASVPVADVAWMLVAAPAYLAEAGMPETPAELATHPGLCYWQEPADDTWTLGDGEQQRVVRVRSRLHVNNPETVAEAALAGLGIAQVPRYLCDEDVAAGRLVQVLPAWTPVNRFGHRISAVATPERMAFARHQALLRYLQQRLAG